MSGCPAHYGCNVRSVLNENYANKWIDREGPVGWPARSPDLTPLDSFLWGVLKQRVYRMTVNIKAALQDRIMLCAGAIRSDPEMVFRATQQIALRATMCLQQLGSPFEHLMH